MAGHLGSGTSEITNQRPSLSVEPKTDHNTAVENPENSASPAEICGGDIIADEPAPDRADIDAAVQSMQAKIQKLREAPRLVDHGGGGDAGRPVGNNGGTNGSGGERQHSQVIGRRRCPYHEHDDNPSLALYDDGHFHCFASHCQKHGAIKDLPPEETDSTRPRIGTNGSKLFSAVDASLRAQGYVRAHDFDITLTDGTILFSEARYEHNTNRRGPRNKPEKKLIPHRIVEGVDRAEAGPARMIYNAQAIMRAGRGAWVVITEGGLKAKRLNEKGLLATYVPFNSWDDDCVNTLRGDHLVYLKDNDASGDTNAEKACQLLAPIAASFRAVPAAHLWKHLPSSGEPLEKDGVEDWLALGGDATQLLEICKELPAWGSSFSTVPLTITEWRARVLPPIDPIMGEMLSTTTRAILHANTGIGKTHFGMDIFGHAAAGKNFLHWRCDRPRRMLYIDGEMSRDLFKERLEDMVQRLGEEPPSFAGFNREDVPDFAPLNTREGQAAFWKLVEEVERRVGGPLDAVSFDNIMTLIVGDMKEEDAWRDTLPLIHEITRRRIGQQWIHHTGHDTSRGYGTKTREWQLDTVMHLDEVKRPDTDVSFTLTFPKARRRCPRNRDDFAETNIALVDGQWVGSVVVTGRLLQPLNSSKRYGMLLRTVRSHISPVCLQRPSTNGRLSASTKV